eukprot:764472-Hanusia_phi.AAC.8
MFKKRLLQLYSKDLRGNALLSILLCHPFPPSAAPRPLLPVPPTPPPPSLFDFAHPLSSSTPSPFPFLTQSPPPSSPLPPDLDPVIPYWEWQRLRGEGERRRYLQALLAQS